MNDLFILLTLFGLRKTNISAIFHKKCTVLKMNSKNIKELRKKIKMTQEELGRAIGVSKRTIINYEKGEVIPQTKNEILHNIASSLEKNVNAASIIYNRTPCSDTDKVETLERLLSEKDRLLAAKDEIITMLKKTKDK